MIDPWVTGDALRLLPEVAAIQSDLVDLDALAAEASDQMWRWSGRQYGTRTQTVRPVVQGGIWRMVGLADDQARSWLDASAELWIPARVAAVVSVRIDGVLLGPQLWQLYDHQRLVRLDGQVWPPDQNLFLPTTAPGTFEIVAQFGQTPPPGGVRAARVYATELAKLDAGLPNRLPKGTTVAAKQGVTVKVRRGQFFRDGEMGVYEIDSFLDAVNPSRKTRRASVASPETIDPLRRT